MDELKDGQVLDYLGEVRSEDEVIILTTPSHYAGMFCLEDAVRYIRLHTRTPITHTMIKYMICSGAGTIGDCENTLRLEMVKVDPRAFSQLDQNADCVDKSLPVEPERGFVLGKQHELMLLRACVKFDTMLPGSNYGFDFETDGSGQGRMMAIASFVQEPN